MERWQRWRPMSFTMVIIAAKIHFSGRISKLYANFLGELLYYFISCSLFVYKVTSSIMFYSITACLSPCYPYHSVPVTLLPRRSCPRVYTLSGKDTTLFIMDNRCNDFYLFHECKDTKKKRKYSHIFREKTCNFQIKT